MSSVWRCQNCGCLEKETPQKRRGPGGRSSLCNKCGLRYSRNRRDGVPNVAAAQATSKALKATGAETSFYENDNTIMKPLCDDAVAEKVTSNIVAEQEDVDGEVKSEDSKVSLLDNGNPAVIKTIVKTLNNAHGKDVEVKSEDSEVSLHDNKTIVKTLTNAYEKGELRDFLLVLNKELKMYNISLQVRTAEYLYLFVFNTSNVELFWDKNCDNKCTELVFGKIGYTRNVEDRIRSIEKRLNVKLECKCTLLKDPSSQRSLIEDIESEVRLQCGWLLKSFELNGKSTGNEFILMLGSTKEYLESMNLKDTGAINIEYHYHQENFPSVHLKIGSENAGKLICKNIEREGYKNETPGTISRRSCPICKHFVPTELRNHFPMPRYLE